MQDRPTSTELIAAVREFLQLEIIPGLDGRRLKYRALIAANVLSVVERELAGEHDRLYQEWQRLVSLMGHDGEQTPAMLDGLRARVEVHKRDLSARIRAGEADAAPWRDAVMDYARWAVTEKLSVSNPRYLERVARDRGSGTE